MNVPNAVTVGRILLVPVVVLVLIESGDGSALAAAVFALAASTDGLDGYLARSRKSVTTLGKVMDPIADKLLIAAALVTLVAMDRLEAWVAILIIGREVAVSALRAAAGRRGVVIAASGFGRAKTFSQVAAVIGLILASDPEAAWVLALVYLAVAVTIASGVDYFLGYRRRETAEPAGDREATASASRTGVGR